MRLLFDQNISFRLCHILKRPEIEITHVKYVGLEDAEDTEIWNFAQKENYSIVTFDADFYELQTLKGHPPKIIWLRFGNATKAELVSFFESKLTTIIEFTDNEQWNGTGCMEFDNLGV